MLLCQNEPGTKCFRKYLTQTGFKALNIFKKMNLHKNFHEILGLGLERGYAYESYPDHGNDGRW